MFNSLMPAPSILVVLATDFEEIEAVVPIDILRRAGAIVTLAALSEEILVAGRNGLIVRADVSLANVESNNFDCLLLPGGPGVARLRTDNRVIDVIRRQHNSGRWIAAICAAPLALLSAGVLASKNYTAHYSTLIELPDAKIDERTVEDGRLLTSRGAGTALEFAMLIVEKLFSREKSQEIARAICA